MIKQYKLRFYNFRLVIFLLAISFIGIQLVGTAADYLRTRQLLGVIIGVAGEKRSRRMHGTSGK